MPAFVASTNKRPKHAHNRSQLTGERVRVAKRRPSREFHRGVVASLTQRVVARGYHAARFGCRLIHPESLLDRITLDKECVMNRFNFARFDGRFLRQAVDEDGNVTFVPTMFSPKKLCVLS